MNIYTVRDNLKNTIAGKEELYNSYQRTNISEFKAVASFLKVNIDELKSILQDVEVCCEQALEASWALNPERMGR